MLGEHGGYTKLKQIDFIIAGATSGSLTRALCQPLDVLKIRFQLQAEPIKHSTSSKYRSVSQAILLIYREEGVKAFWKGHVPAQLLSIVYGCVQFWCYEIFMKSVNPIIGDHRKHVAHFVGGALAGSAATLVSFPFDIVRTRLVGQSENAKLYKNVFHAFVHIYKYEGVPIYFRGLTPAIIQVAPHTGAQFMFYKLTNTAYKKLFKIEEYSATGSFIAGSFAGFCAKLVVYPFDLVRKRLQIQGFHQHRGDFGRTYHYEGMVDSFLKIFRHEGAHGFFKGLSPSLLKAVFTTALHFSSYEFVCQFLEQTRV